MVRYIALALWIWSAFFPALLLVHQPAFANGGTTDLRERVGKYEINIAAPSGAVAAESNYHLSVMVVDAATDFLVQDTTVEITALPPPELANAAPIGPIPFPPVTQDAYRHLDISMPEEGKWTMRIDIDGPLGAARTEYSLRVAGGGIPWGTVAVTGASIFLLFALGWTVSSRGPRATRKSASRKSRSG